jgi:N-methylhydantoinase B/oxoprolinase/acetone carboxylase alpha subunit
VKGNINSTVTVTLAAVLYSLKALLDPEVPNNQGLIEIRQGRRAGAHHQYVEPAR